MFNGCLYLILMNVFNTGNLYQSIQWWLKLLWAWGSNWWFNLNAMRYRTFAIFREEQQ